MKSIIEEAPSILKAIEKAWIRAGNPREFSVKIFEDAQKSFFGLTTKQHAKVGVFFEIEPIQADAGSSAHMNRPARPHTPQKPLQRHEGQASHSHEARQGQHATSSTHREIALRSTQQRPAPRDFEETANSHSEIEQNTAPAEPKKQRIAWNDEMLTAVSMWLKDLLAMSNLGTHQPTITVLDNRLIILFEKPLFDDQAKASDLYRSLSYLLIGMVRSKFKREFRFLKIVLTDGLRDRGTES